MRLAMSCKFVAVLVAAHQHQHDRRPDRHAAHRPAKAHARPEDRDGEHPRQARPDRPMRPKSSVAMPATVPRIVIGNKQVSPPPSIAMMIQKGLFIDPVSLPAPCGPFASRAAGLRSIRLEPGRQFIHDPRRSEGRDMAIQPAILAARTAAAEQKPEAMSNRTDQRCKEIRGGHVVALCV